MSVVVLPGHKGSCGNSLKDNDFKGFGDDATLYGICT